MNAPIAVMIIAPSTRRDFASADKLLDSNVSFNRHKPVQNKQIAELLLIRKSSCQKPAEQVSFSRLTWKNKDEGSCQPSNRIEDVGYLRDKDGQGKSDE